MRILPESFQGTPIWSASRDLPSQSLVSIPMSKKHDRQSSNQHLGQVNPSEWVLPTTHWKVFRCVLTLCQLAQMHHWRWSWIEPWCGEIGRLAPQIPSVKKSGGRIWRNLIGLLVADFHTLLAYYWSDYQEFHTLLAYYWSPRPLLIISTSRTNLVKSGAHWGPFRLGQWWALVDVGSYHKNSKKFQQKHHHQYQQKQQQQQYLLMMMSSGWLAIGLRLPPQWVGDLMKTEQGIVGI